MKISNEFEVGINSVFGQLKNIDNENETALHTLSDNLKKESTQIFETIKKENQAIETNEVKVNSMMKEVVEKATVF